MSIKKGGRSKATTHAWVSNSSVVVILQACQIRNMVSEYRCDKTRPKAYGSLMELLSFFDVTD